MPPPPAVAAGQQVLSTHTLHCHPSKRLQGRQGGESLIVVGVSSVRAATTPILKQFSGNLLGKSSYVGESRAQQHSAIAPHTALQVISQIATYDCAGPCLGHASLTTADTLLMHGFTAARALQLVELASAMTGGSL